MLVYYPERRGASWGETAIDVGVVPAAVEARTSIASVRTWRQRLPADVIVLSKAEFVAKEQQFWENAAPPGSRIQHRRGDGFHRRPGDLLSEVLFSEISDRLAEFATLEGDGLQQSRAVPGRRRPVRLLWHF